MRTKFNKDIEFLFKKIFIPEQFLFKKRIKRAIQTSYEDDLLILDKIVNKKIKYRQPLKTSKKLNLIGNNILKKNLNEINKYL